MLQTTLPPPLTKRDRLCFPHVLAATPMSPEVQKLESLGSVASVCNTDSLNQMVTGNAGSRKTN